MKKIVLVAVLLPALLAPGIAQAQGQSSQAQDKSRHGFYKLFAGTLSASIGVMLIKAGNTPDPFTGDKPTGQLALGAVMTGGGGWLMWNGWNDIQNAKKMPSVGLYIQPKRKSAAVVYRRSWRR
jgi:hypothetical protein